MPQRPLPVRIRVRALALAIAVSALHGAAHACGPDFPPSLLDQREQALLRMPEGVFAFEAGRLQTPSDPLRAAETGEWGDLEAERSKAEAIGLTPAQVDAVAAMRAAESVAAAEALGDALPADVRLYTAGAIAWHAGDYATALERFRAVVALPPGERALRGVWASYMEARTLAWNGDRAGAEAAFERTREWARGGAADPLGLAVASYGEQARLALQADDWAAAVPLYAEQAARDSQSGRQSLLEVARHARDDPQTLAALLADPHGRSLLVAYLFSRSNELTADADAAPVDPDVDPEHAPRTPLTAAALLARLAEHAATMPAVDRLAAVAYRAGRYAEAQQFAKASPSPLAAWVRAKLALRSGDVDTAAAAYAEAARGFPADETWGLLSNYDDESGYLGSETLTPACRINGEAGTLALSRGDFTQALELLYAAADVYWPDAGYVAERVVTVDELRAFVDRVAAEPQPPRRDAWGNWETPQHAAALRWLLARRLLRADRYDDALAYFDAPETRAAAERYVAARRAAADESGIDRARALFAAAQTARHDGMELLGYEGDPDYFVWGGSYDLNSPITWDEDYNPIVNPRTDLAITGAYASDAERSRLAQSRAQPLERFHYRLTAAQLAAQAADALPPRSQAFAAVLCEGTHWLIDRHPEPAQALYRRYLREGAYVPWGAAFGRECPAPDFDKAEREVRARFIAKVKRIALWTAPPTALLLVLGGWFMIAMRRNRLRTS